VREDGNCFIVVFQTVSELALDGFKRATTFTADDAFDARINVKACRQ
jgi:hypothetical protein